MQSISMQTTSPHWAHMSKDILSDITTRIETHLGECRKALYGISLTHLSLEAEKCNIGKQRRPRSDAT